MTLGHDHQLEPLAARIERYRPLVLEEMRAVVGSRPEGLFAWMRFHLGWEDEQGRPVDDSPGKMLRSTAVLLAAELTGADADAAAPAAAAVDLVHNFSLLHDDIEDASETRRGRRTVWTVAGVPQAINTGDGMFTISRLAMHRLLERGVEERRVVAAMRELDEACLRLVEGQYLDMAFEQQARVTRDEYLAMATGKTAAMFAAPFAMGALLAGARGEVVAALRTFGMHVGLAFQALDDLLDCWGTREALGKDPGGDLLARKKTYPVLVGLGDSSSEFARAYAAPPESGEDFRSLAALLEDVGGRRETEAWATAQMAAAHAAVVDSRLSREVIGVLDEYIGAATGRTPSP